ncbi:DMT family transporter [Vibrio sp.]|uniref:DMT family transporter n=1 Tax=Vibrio sp. TaxID=678 RepID=UPI0031202000
MSTASFVRLICLAAIWGSSFLFMKISTFTFGPAFLIEFRVGFAGLSLFLVSIYLRKKLAFLDNFKHFMIIGLFNSALPFLLFAYAAQTLNASTLAVLNSTAAIWGALIGVFWHKTILTLKAFVGMGFGVIGVVVLVGLDAVNIGIDATLPIAAGVMAACSYGLATNYTKTAPSIDSFENAHGNMWAAVLWILPLLPFVPMQGEPSIKEMWSVLVLGVLCTGVAYLLYFRLVVDEGASSALSVTFLVPVFGILWGALILDEPIGLNTFVGTFLVLSGTMLVTGFSPAQLIRKRQKIEQV